MSPYVSGYDGIYGRFDSRFDLIRIARPDSIRDSIRTQTADSQVPTINRPWRCRNKTPWVSEEEEQE